MGTKIFVNLPVKDLEKSKQFFEKLGYRFNPQFTDDTAACMVISDDIYAMLLTHKKWNDIVPKPIADTRSGSECTIALTANSRAAVDEMVRRALANGATMPKAAEDHGFMYQHGFEDLDGHLWEVLYMQPSFVKASRNGKQPVWTAPFRMLGRLSRLVQR